MENENIILTEENPTEAAFTPTPDEPHEKNVKLMSPTQMVLRRFLRTCEVL